MLKSVVMGAVIGAFGFLGTAEASIVTVSYFGQIGSGSDATNVFGTASSGSADLNGQFVTLTYVFDTNKGVHSNADGVDLVSGYSFLNQQSPALTASVTINNKTISFAGNESGYISASDSTGYSMLSQSAVYDADAYTYASTELTAPLGSFPNVITHPLSIALGGNGEPTAFGGFGLYNTDPTTGYNVNVGYFDARSINISVVPLPSALPLFGLALAGLGTAAAFRKRHGLRASR